MKNLKLCRKSLSKRAYVFRCACFLLACSPFFLPSAKGDAQSGRDTRPVANAGASVATMKQETASFAPLKVMTFNLRYASTVPPHSWPERRPVLGECLRQAAPDVIGTQEGLFEQLKDIAADQPAYAWIGLGRDGGSWGEFMAVFYRKERLEPLEFDHFWLSDTPQVIGSKTWGPTLARMVTWVRFRDRQSRQEFYFINTHLDHAVQGAREKSAALIVQRVQTFDPSLPILLVGDFNAAARGNRVYDILTKDAGFQDTWVTARRRNGPDVATFHGYKPAIAQGPHIDWILSRGSVITQDTQVVMFQRNSQYPSDHFPLVATLLLPASGGLTEATARSKTRSR